MPYIDKQPAIGDTTTDNDVLTRGEAKVLIEKLLSNSLFHELEPVEVLDVYVNPEDPAYDQYETFTNTFLNTEVPSQLIGERIQNNAPEGYETYEKDLDNVAFQRDRTLIGAIRGRYVVSQQGDSIEEMEQGKNVLLKQRTQETLQLIVQE